ncbi:MAG TPA: SCP2 sterol-binding domain-containing protein [Candidatus Obscuribacterales bacterium]
MPFFTNTDELHRIQKELWTKIKNDPEISGRLLESKLIVQFQYREPDGRVTIDCSDGKEMHVHTGESSLKPTVEMSMKADVAHEFWLGKVNVPLAIIAGKIVAKGPVHKALALLPVIKPAFALYPPIIKELGKKALV